MVKATAAAPQRSATGLWVKDLEAGVSGKAGILLAAGARRLTGVMSLLPAGSRDPPRNHTKKWHTTPTRRLVAATPRPVYAR